MTEAELQREIHRRRRVETLQGSQQAILRLIATGDPLIEVLGALVDLVENLFPPSLCALLVYDPGDDCLTVGAAQNIDPELRQLLADMPLEPDLSSFSAAALQRETVIVTDIATDKTCGKTRAAALRAGYRSCWAHPVLSASGELLGVIGMYNRDARAPHAEELRVIGELCDLAGIAIGHDRAEQRMRTLSSAVEQTDDAVVIMDRDGNVEYANPAFERISGLDRDTVLGQTLELVNPEFHEPGFHAELWMTIRAGGVFRDVFINRRRNGQLYYEEKTITPLRDPDNEVRHFVATGKDITAHMEIRQRLHYLAHHDVLTGLANRALLFDHLDNALAQARRGEQMVALLYLDLDGFKTINDNFGHSSGDRVLKAVAQRLDGAVREADTVARLGGDEFIILLPGARHVDEPAHVAQNLLEALRSPLLLVGGQEVCISASIGITVFPVDGEDGESLMRNADLAMYRAKRRGGDNYQFHAEYMTAQTSRHLDLEERLRHARQQEFSLSYQPRIASASGDVCAIEALLHWKEPQLGEVAMNDFVPLLEETGLILTVGRWALQAACQYASHLQSSGHEGVRVAVKLSVPQFRDPGLARFIQQCLSETGLQGHHLEVAISAELLVDSSINTLPMLDELHAMGLRVCVQGFGNGQVPLTSLTRAPLDTLTIDRTFVGDISHSADHRAVVSAITAVARSLGYSVLAEGVENEEQLTLLREQGCDELQGSYFSQPLDAAGLEAWLSHHRTGTQRGAGATLAPFDS